jgi:hypothetical protein
MKQKQSKKQQKQQTAPPKDNVTSITQALSKLRSKSRLNKNRSKPRTVYVPAPADDKPKGGGVPGFPIIEGLDEEKTIIGQGIVALNRALFEQTIYESTRLGKIRGILSSIETELLDEKLIKAMDPVQRMKLFEILRKDSEASVGFLERMQGNSLRVMVIFDIYKKLMDTISQPPDQSHTSLPADMDKDKVMQVRGALIEMMKQ